MILVHFKSRNHSTQFDNFYIEMFATASSTYLHAFVSLRPATTTITPVYDIFHNCIPRLISTEQKQDFLRRKGIHEYYTMTKTHLQAFLLFSGSFLVIFGTSL